MHRNRFALAALVLALVTGAETRAACTAANPNANLPESTPSAAFIDHGDGTVTHSLTGLMWKQCAQGLSGAGCATGTATNMTWSGALTAAKNDTAAGYSDWRLPNKKELESIVEDCGNTPAINQAVFPSMPIASVFWSASAYAGLSDSAWYLDFGLGYANTNGKSGSLYVRLVRGGQSFASYDAQTADTTPDAYTFTAQTGVALSTAITSNPITVAGITAAAAISIAGGSYAINGGAYTATAGTVNNGDTVTLQLTSSASYSTPTTATLTIGGVTGGFSATTLSAPPPPSYDPGPYVPPPVAPPVTPPPTPVPTPSGDSTPVTTAGELVTNPDPHITVDATNGAATIITPPSAPYVISPKAPDNALIKLPVNQPVSITASNTTLTYTDKTGNSQLLVRNPNGTPQIEVGQGHVQIDSTATGNTIPVVSSNQKVVGAITTATAKDSITVVRNDTQANVYADAGKVDYLQSGQGKPLAIYQGEHVRLDTGGKVAQMALGSADGAKQVPGDPLPPQPGHAPDTKVPKLDGKLARFNNKLSLLDILRDAIEELLGGVPGQISYDKTSGVVTYAIGNQSYRLIPLGEILVQLNQLSAASASATVGGAYTLVVQGVQMSLSGAVGYFSDLQQAVKALDANGAITLTAGGILDMKVGGKRYAGIPGMAASLPAAPTPIPGFETNGGLIVFRDHLGMLQALYPAFLDADSVIAALKGVDPAASLTNNGDGTLTAIISGKSYTFLPEYRVLTATGNQLSTTWWVDGGLVYIRNADNSVQGFRLR